MVSALCQFSPAGFPNPLGATLDRYFGAKSANDELRAGLAADLAQAVAALPSESVESETLERDPVQRPAESSAGLALLVLRPCDVLIVRDDH